MSELRASWRNDTFKVPNGFRSFAVKFTCCGINGVSSHIRKKEMTHQKGPLHSQAHIYPVIQRISVI